MVTAFAILAMFSQWNCSFHLHFVIAEVWHWLLPMSIAGTDVRNKSSEFPFVWIAICNLMKLHKSWYFFQFIAQTLPSNPWHQKGHANLLFADVLQYLHLLHFLQNNHNHLAYMKCAGQCRARVKTNSRGCHSHRTKNNTAPTRILMVKATMMAIFINIGNIIMAQLISWWRLISHWFPMHLSPPSLYVQDMIMIMTINTTQVSDVLSSGVWCTRWLDHHH